MLSKVSIKDHLQCEQIVELAKEIHAGEPKHLHQGKNARDYLMEAKTMFEASQASRPTTKPPTQPQPYNAATSASRTMASFSQVVKEGKRSPHSVYHT